MEDTQINNAEKRYPHKPNGDFDKGNVGRPKGSKNKYTQLRDSFLEAFENIGGTKALAEWGKSHKKDFYHIVSRMLPSNIKAEIDIKEKQVFNINIEVTGNGHKPEEAEKEINRIASVFERL